MSPIIRLLRYYYSIETRSSIDQLRDDFGKFPPLPLQCEGPNGNFDVIRVRGIAEAWHKMTLYRTLLLSAGTTEHELSAVHAAGIGDSISSMHTALERIGSHKAKRICAFLCLAMLFTREAWRQMRHRSSFSALGVFTPVRKNESEILIRVAPLEREERSHAATISHEHIHLLQHSHADLNFRRTVKDPRMLIGDETLVGDPFKLKHILYILEQIEMEARLHEVVLSFYRVYEHLPATLTAFFGMMAAGQETGLTVRAALTGERIPFTVYGEFAERSRQAAVDIDWVYCCMREEVGERFIIEVLPVMYGNLLKYYGDDAVSQRFLEEIQRPNLFDDIYAG